MYCRIILNSQVMVKRITDPDDNSLELTINHEWFKPLTLRAAKTSLTIWEISYLQKHFLKTFEGEMLIRCQATIPLQLFCERSLYTQVIFKGMRVADDTFVSTDDRDMQCRVRYAYSSQQVSGRTRLAS